MDYSPTELRAGLMTLHDAAEYLGVCEGTIQYYRRKGRLSVTRIAGRLYFDPAELNSLVEHHAPKAN